MLGALSRAFARGDDLGARTAMANGATIARAGVLDCVGNHALAHAVRARFGPAHGRANVLFLCTCSATCRGPSLG